MTKEQIYDVMAKAGYFHLATVADGRPKVRAIMLYRAGKDGIIFHTSRLKDLYKQLAANPAAEICVYDPAQNLQIRVSGEFIETGDAALKEEIFNHPSRGFLREMKKNMPEGLFDKTFAVFRMQSGKAVTWTMGSNFEPKTEITL